MHNWGANDANETYPNDMKYHIFILELKPRRHIFTVAEIFAGAEKKWKNI